MGFVEAVRTCLGKYATFSGRARRPEFWWFFLFAMLAGTAATAIDALIGFASADSGPIGTIVALALLLPNLAVTWRRLHDTGRSGWWAALPYGAGIAGSVMLVVVGAARGPQGDPGPLISGLSLVVVIGIVVAFVALLAFLLGASQPGANRFGPEPAR